MILGEVIKILPYGTRMQVIEYPGTGEFSWQFCRMRKIKALVRIVGGGERGM